MNPERSEIGHGGDGRSLGFFRQTPFFGGLEKLFVLGRQFCERLFIKIGEDGHDYAVFNFNGHTNINRCGQDNFVADQPSS